MAVGLMYTAQFQNIAITNVVQDIWQLNAAAACSVVVHSWRLTFTPTIVSGVAQDVRLQFQILNRSTAGTGGTGVTPGAVNPRNTVVASTVVNRTVVTTQGTAGTIHSSDNISVIVPWERIYTEAQRIPIPAGSSNFLCLLLVATNAALPLNASSEVYFEEL
jgi:hypothetical protein